MSMNFKLGTYIQQDLWVTWSNFWGNRSKI